MLSAAENTVAHLLADIADSIARSARARFPADSPAGRRLRALRRKLPRRPPERPIGQVIFEFARHTPYAYVVQIGAHDGTAIDPLRDEILSRNWSGLLVEPVPYVFNRLRANYASNPRIAVENSAVGDSDGTREFFHLPESSEDALWKWYDALGSFRRDVVARHADLIPDIEDRIVTTVVPCLTFDSLFRKHGVTRIDVLQTDTEGYDCELLKLLDLDRWQPSVLMYEHVHLTDAEQAQARSLLERRDYLLIADGMDTLGVHTSTFARIPELRALWDGLVAAGSGDE